MSWFSRLKNAVNSRRLEEDLVDEMRDHRKRREAALRATGLSASDARRQADMRFGNITRFKEESRGIRLGPGSTAASRIFVMPVAAFVIRPCLPLPSCLWHSLLVPIPLSIRLWMRPS